MLQYIVTFLDRVELPFRLSNAFIKRLTVIMQHRVLGHCAFSENPIAVFDSVIIKPI